MLFFPVHTCSEFRRKPRSVESDPRLLALSGEGLTLLVPICEGSLEGPAPFALSREALTPESWPSPRFRRSAQQPSNALTPLQSALTQNAPVTRLESALTNLEDLKPFRINTYKKGGGEGANC